MNRSVSIAMTTYNAGDYLVPQIESLLAQTYDPLEIVVADDGSTDGTYEKLLAYAKTDSRLRILPKDKRLGLNENFLKCFKACSGELISPCDHDDIWSPDKTSKLVEASSSGGIAYCNSHFTDAHGTPAKGDRARISDVFALQDNPPLLGMLMNIVVAGHAMIFPKKMLIDIDRIPEHSFFDWWIILIACERGYPITYVDEELVLYRRHARAATATTTKTQAQKKVLSLTKQYATAYAFSRQLASTAENQVVRLYPQALEAWLTSWISVRSFIFFWRNRNDCFGIKSRNIKSLMALRYLFGYRLRSFINKKKYPPLLSIKDGITKFNAI